MNTFSHAFEQRPDLLNKASLQYGMSPPATHSGHPHASTEMFTRSVPFLFYPTGVDSGFYENSYRNTPALIPYLPPFHGRFGVYECPFEPAFIQKRNERERQRVKCVNQGYAKLRDHLPGSTGEKRLSKVETLRAAIRYIKYLQGLVDGERREGVRENFNSHLRVDVSGNSDGGSPRSLSLPSSPGLYCEDTEGSGM
ncbi:achaete-scute homolog 5-like [Clupea harengus]|uniref:Achaete-scute homolog 5-like n=1 Tax=Clupea harengus TaxID=7950 RepID=A0A6P8FHA6_CLUHA|nr:achaete-scute homolog 5-like [Clupea harengus]